MVKLCSNREEGFGPNSPLSSPLPTTCFTDVVIIPLPVCVYLVLLLLFVGANHFQQHRNFDPSTAYLRTVRHRSTCRIILVILYCFFLVANILMQTLEIVRLELIDFGIGLLPFSYVALLTGLLLHLTDGLRQRIHRPFWKGANTFVWIGLMAANIVKMVGLVQMEKSNIYRTDTKYTMSDQVIDVAVMAGLYLVITLLEALLGVWRRERIVEGGLADGVK